AYKLTASGPGGNSAASVTVMVAPPAPRIVIARLPGGMLQATGTSGATDSLTFTNAGSAPGNVTLTQSGNFFAVAPDSFTLPAGTSQVISVTANSHPAGTYDGSITVSGGPTIPVHLLVAAPPASPVNPKPASPRTDVSASASQVPTGSVQFSNNGPGTVTGI